MTRPRSMNNYPAAFLDLLAVFDRDPKTKIEIPYDTVAKAKSFRLSFYTFKAAALKEGLQGLYPSLPAIGVLVKDFPPRVVFEHKDYGEDASKIMNALSKVEGEKR